jgi:hypothetical protein
MFFNGYDGSRCPGGGSHAADGLLFVLPHDVLETPITQGNWRYCKNCHGMFFNGYGGGRCPAGGSHAADGMIFVLPHRQDLMLPWNIPPGGAGINPKDLKAMFSGFLANANYYGMPTKFLAAVGKGYDLTVIAEKESEAFDRARKQMELHRSTYDLLVGMNADLPFGEAGAIDNVYHEATHAYLELKREKFKKLIADGEKYYTDAPMKGGGTSKDPARVFQEAAASYVGRRAAAWWAAFEVLTTVLVPIATRPERVDVGRLKSNAQTTRTEYNDQMKKRDYGYEGDPTQVSTSKPISADMKATLDSELLEGKIPDEFDQVPKFAQLLMEIQTAGTGP